MTSHLLATRSIDWSLVRTDCRYLLMIELHELHVHGQRLGSFVSWDLTVIIRPKSGKPGQTRSGENNPTCSSRLRHGDRRKIAEILTLASRYRFVTLASIRVDHVLSRFVGRGFAGLSLQKAKRKKPNHECVVLDDESGLPKNQAICFFATASEMRCCTAATYCGRFWHQLGTVMSVYNIISSYMQPEREPCLCSGRMSVYLCREQGYPFQNIYG